jgi:hypothetical protein
MGGAIFKKAALAEPDDDGEGSADAKRIIQLIEGLEKDIATWNAKIADAVEKDTAPQIELRFRHERAEMIRRLGLLRRRPKTPRDDQPVITLSTYHRARGSTSATLRILKRGAESGACMCGKCEVFCPNEYDLSLCATCNHKLEAHQPPEGSTPFQRSALAHSFPVREPTRKDKERMTQRSDLIGDPSYFEPTDDDRNRARDAPPRPEGIDGPDFHSNGDQREDEQDVFDLDVERRDDADKKLGKDDDEHSVDTAEPEVEDEINQAHIEQELIDNGFSAEAGRGLLTYADESHYDGEWAVFEKHGKIERHGYGTMHYKSGEVHAGDFQRDVRHGKGKLIHADGSVYHGEWKYGEISGDGRGSMPSADGSGKYVGQWFNGQRQGRGTMVSATGDEYSGEFFDDLFHGFGTFIAANGDEYVGTWMKGEMTGKGTMKWRANGDSYTGSWSQGIMHGEGTFVSGTDGSTYRGRFENGEKIGHGVIELAGGDSFSGLFDGDSTDGVFGIIKTSAGDQFEVCPRDFRLRS